MVMNLPSLCASPIVVVLIVLGASRGACPPSTVIDASTTKTVSDCINPSVQYEIANYVAGVTLTIERFQCSGFIIRDPVINPTRGSSGIRIQDSTMHGKTEFVGEVSGARIEVRNTNVEYRSDDGQSVFQFLKGAKLNNSFVVMSLVTVADGPAGAPWSIIYLERVDHTTFMLDSLRIETQQEQKHQRFVSAVERDTKSEMQSENVRFYMVSCSMSARPTVAAGIIEAIRFVTTNWRIEVESASLDIDQKNIDYNTTLGSHYGLVHIAYGAHKDLLVDLFRLTLNQSYSMPDDGPRVAIVWISHVGALHQSKIELKQSTQVINQASAYKTSYGIVITGLSRTGTQFANGTDITVEDVSLDFDTVYGYKVLTLDFLTLSNSSVMFRNVNATGTVAEQNNHFFSTFYTSFFDSTVQFDGVRVKGTKKGTEMATRYQFTNNHGGVFNRTSITVVDSSIGCYEGPGAILFVLENRPFVCNALYFSDSLIFEDGSVAIQNFAMDVKTYVSGLFATNMSNVFNSKLTLDGIDLKKSDADLGLTLVSASDSSLWDNLDISIANVYGGMASRGHSCALTYFFFGSEIRLSSLSYENITVTIDTSLHPLTAFLAPLFTQFFGYEAFSAGMLLGVVANGLMTDTTLKLSNISYTINGYEFAHLVEVLAGGEIRDSLFELADSDIHLNTLYPVMLPTSDSSALIAANKATIASSVFTVRDTTVKLDATLLPSRLLDIGGESQLNNVSFTMQVLDVTAASPSHASFVGVHSGTQLNDLVIDCFECTIDLAAAGTEAQESHAHLVHFNASGPTAQAEGVRIRFDAASEVSVSSNSSSAGVVWMGSSIPITDIAVDVAAAIAVSSDHSDVSFGTFALAPLSSNVTVTAADSTLTIIAPSGSATVLNGLSQDDGMTVTLSSMSVTAIAEADSSVFLDLRGASTQAVSPSLRVVSTDVTLDGVDEFTSLDPDTGTLRPTMELTTSCTIIPNKAILRPKSAAHVDPSAFRYSPLTLHQQLHTCFNESTTPTMISLRSRSHSTTSTKTELPPTRTRPESRSATPTLVATDTELPEEPPCGDAKLDVSTEPYGSSNWNTSAHQLPGTASQHERMDANAIAAAGIRIILQLWTNTTDIATGVVRFSSVAGKSVAVRCVGGSSQDVKYCDDYLSGALVRPIEVQASVMIIGLRPDPSFQVFSDVSIDVKVPAAAIACSGSASPALEEVTVDLKVHPTSMQEQTATSMSAMSYAGAASAAAGAGALGDTQALAAFGLISCASSSDRYAMKSASWLLSPTPIGDGPEGFVLFNLVVTFTCFGIQVTLLGLVYGFKKYIRKSAVVNAAVIQGDLRFPSLFVVFAGVFQQGTSILSLRLLLDGRITFVAVFGAAFSLSFPWAVYVYSRRVARPVFAADISSRLVFFKYEGVGENWPPRIREALKKWILPVGRWGPPLMRKRFGGPVGACMPLWTLYGAVPPLQALGVSIVASVKTGTMAGCMAQYGVLMVMYLVFGTAIVYIQPYRSMFLNITAVISSYALAAALVVHAMKASDPRRPGMEESSFSLMTGLMGLSYVRMIYGYWLMVAERFLWRSNASKTFWNENRDSVATASLYKDLVSGDSDLGDGFIAMEYDKETEMGVLSEKAKSSMVMVSRDDVLTAPTTPLPQIQLGDGRNSNSLKAGGQLTV